MSFLIPLIILVASVIAGRLFRPKVSAKRDGQQLQFPTIEEGTPLPIPCGLAKVVPILRWYGDVQSGEPPDGAPDGTIFYFANVCLLLGHGPIEALADIAFADKSLAIWPKSRESAPGPGEAGIGDGGELVSAQPFPMSLDPDTPLTVLLSAQNLFGGPKEQGGIFGNVWVYAGGQDQVTPNPLLVAALGADRAPGYPRICYLIFEGITAGNYPASVTKHGFYWTANSPVPPAVTALVLRRPFALSVLVFGEPSRAHVGLYGANGAEIIYELLTDPIEGEAIERSLLDLASFADVLDTLSSEGLELSGTIAERREVQDIIDDVNRHIDGVLFDDPETGLATLRLARGGYDPETLPVLTPAEAYDVVPERIDWRETTNELTLVYQEFNAGAVGAVTDEAIAAARIRVWGTFVASPGSPQYVTSYIFQTQGRNISNVFVHNATTDETVGPLVEGQFSALDPVWLVSASSGAIIMISRDPFPGNLGGFFSPGDVITVSYRAGGGELGYRDATVTVRDPANQLQTGGVRAQVVRYDWMTSPFHAAQRALLLLRSLSRPLQKVTWKTNRSKGLFRPADVVILDIPNQDLNLAVIRVTDAKYGTLEQGFCTYEGLEDVFGEGLDLSGVVVGGGGGFPTPGMVVAPAVVISCVVPSGVRIGLFTPDPNFNFEVERATDDIGTDAETISPAGGVAGDETFIEDEQESGCFYYRARGVGGPGMGTVEPSEWTEWMKCCVTAGTPGTPECAIPTVTVSKRETATAGTLELVVTDPQSRVKSVVFQARSAPSAPPGDAETPPPDSDLPDVPPAPDEPGDLTLFAEALCDDVPSSGGETPAGWTGTWKDFGAGVLVTDQSGALISPPDAIRYTLPNGMADGAGLPPTSGWDVGGSGVTKSKLMIRACIRIGDTDYENHPVLTKLFLIGSGRTPDTAANDVIIGILGDGVRAIKNSWRLSIAVQNIVSQVAIPTGFRVTTGGYHIVDILMETNDIGQANGKATMWVDGVAALYSSTMTYRSAAYPNKFFAFKTGIVWGGRGSVKTRDDHIYVEHVRLLGVA